MEMKNETPSKSKIVNKVLTSSVNCDSPFRLLPNISTPPSRFTRILNPFEPHLIERLHLPTFSPSVFAQVSTPKTEEKFRWTIDEISSLKPADIDEDTISQHVIEQDPTVESLVQEKIDKFFSDKAIVPSPLNEQVKRAPLITSPESDTKIPCFDGCTQTVLTLPPILPKHVEDILKPYFTHHEKDEIDEESSLYRKLFEFDDHGVDDNPPESVESSPALSTGLSPIQLSPEFMGKSPKQNFESPIEMPELRDCTLSPIGRSPRESRSACRLSFSENMSVDASLIVPDVNQSLNFTQSFAHIDQEAFPLMNEPETSANWDMEYKQVSILSQSPISSPELIDKSNSNTPHSKIFTSQRKRLSDSFRNEESERDVEMEEQESIPKRSKNRVIRDDVTDVGYHTGGTTICENSLHLFASTPTKAKN